MVAWSKGVCSAIKHFPPLPLQMHCPKCWGKEKGTWKGPMDEEPVFSLVSPNNYSILSWSMNFIRMVQEEGWYQLTPLVKIQSWAASISRHLWPLNNLATSSRGLPVSGIHISSSLPSQGGYQMALGPNLSCPSTLALRLAGLCEICYPLYFSGAQDWWPLSGGILILMSFHWPCLESIGGASKLVTKPSSK